jgi:hypothetical protein
MISHRKEEPDSKLKEGLIQHVLTQLQMEFR